MGQGAPGGSGSQGSWQARRWGAPGSGAQAPGRRGQKGSRGQCPGVCGRGARGRRPPHLGSGSRIFLLARAAGVALLFSMAIR